MSPVDALVLAGRRGGADPLAQCCGAAHRALLPVHGVPMLLRVVRALRAAPCIGRIAVSIDDPDALDSLAELRDARDGGELLVYRSLDSPSRSVSHVLDSRPADAPLLVTTADHALLTPEAIGYFVSAAEGGDADVLVGVVAASLLRARHPETRRTYLRMRGESWTGANLFLFRSERARRAAAFWVRVERHRKRPWRMARGFGFGLLLLFLLRRLDLAEALSRISRAIGAEIRAVSLPFAEAGIDVDRPSDLALAERILAGRERSALCA